MAEDSSSSHILISRHRRRQSPTTSTSKQESSPENSLSSYEGDVTFNCTCMPTVTCSVEYITAMQKKIDELEKTVLEEKLKRDNEHKMVSEIVIKLEGKVDGLEKKLEGAHELKKDIEVLKQAFSSTLKTIPEHSDKGSQSHNVDVVHRVSAYNGTNDELATNTVVISCITQTATKSTNSTPFFSDKGNSGYQMCIHVNASDEINPELSFSLVIMRGKVDKHLPWPFSREITFRLINKDDCNKHKIVTVQPKSEKSFHRPKSDLNEPFVFLQNRYSRLFDDGFIRDDKITFHVTVT